MLVELAREALLLRGEAAGGAVLDLGELLRHAPVDPVDEIEDPLLDETMGE